jgi:nicotinamide mononucleotide (NMN) deamidase PncC
VGLVFIAVATPREAVVKRLDLGKAPREDVLSCAICAALELFVDIAASARRSALG